MSWPVEVQAFSRLNHIDLTGRVEVLALGRDKAAEFFHDRERNVLKTVRDLPDDCSIDEIADRIEFLAAVQKGLDQLDRGEAIPH